MSAAASARVPFDSSQPFRLTRPATAKLIFLSLEGCVTEEGYFRRVRELFLEISSKIQFISVAEDAVNTPPADRTQQQNRMLSRTRPLQLVERIDEFKATKETIFEFSKHQDDEFWIVADVDDNFSNKPIHPGGTETYLEEWRQVVQKCTENNYHYALSNPFFELWLLLHHDDLNDEDKKYAVISEVPHEKTGHFRKRLQQLGVPLKNRKEIVAEDYTREGIDLAIQRAKDIHQDKNDLEPHYLASTVYRLLDKIKMIQDENEMA